VTRDDIKRVIGYVRVSTADQVDSGAGLQAQRSAIEEEARRHHWQLLEIHEDAGASGKSLKGRPALALALSALKAHSADALVAAKLDRLSRSIYDFAGMLEAARVQGWALVALDFDLDTSTPTGELVANVVMATAQWERRAIGQRTKDALAVKKAQGVQLGRPRMIDAKLEQRIRLLHRRSGLSYEAIAARLSREGVPAPASGQWNWSTIRRVANRGPLQRKLVAGAAGA
jgi:DNA invertase Pin-like site-specific DNA recombinase